MKYHNLLLTFLLATSLLSAKGAPSITPAYLRTRIATIHTLNHESVSKLATLIKKLPRPAARFGLKKFAQKRLNKVKKHPLKGNILIGDSHKVTQENLTELIAALTPQ